ncbi:hypothetical protein AMCSP08_000106 [Streptococcus pneumoniae 2072047]|nr:hypothetical protein AMCSP08_000106 [Streptococcus pneumoniae 2072047]
MLFLNNSYSFSLINGTEKLEKEVKPKTNSLLFESLKDILKISKL